MVHQGDFEEKELLFHHKSFCHQIKRELLLRHDIHDSSQDQDQAKKKKHQRHANKRA